MKNKRKSRIHPLTWWDKRRIQFYHKLSNWMENRASEIEIGFFDLSRGARPKDLYDRIFCPLCGGRIIHDYFMHGICEFFDCSYAYDFDELCPKKTPNPASPLHFEEWNKKYCHTLEEKELSIFNEIMKDINPNWRNE
jgi:hypothetical protein